MKSPDEVMPPETARIFRALEANKLLGCFVLIGGTALALHLGHRKSEDLDFIMLSGKLPRLVLQQVWHDLSSAGHDLKHQDDAAAEDDFAISGMDIRDFHQNWLVNGKVKLTFFAADPEHQKVMEIRGEGDHFSIASVEEIFRLKALVASTRSKSRDWLDLYLLNKHFGWGLQEWRSTYEQAGFSDSHFESALGRICCGRLSINDEGFETLLPDPPTLEEITKHFVALREQYELNASKAKLANRESS